MKKILIILFIAIIAIVCKLFILKNYTFQGILLINKCNNVIDKASEKIPLQIHKPTAVVPYESFEIRLNDNYFSGLLPSGWIIEENTILPIEEAISTPNPLFTLTFKPLKNISFNHFLNPVITFYIYPSVCQSVADWQKVLMYPNQQILSYSLNNWSVFESNSKSRKYYIRLSKYKQFLLMVNIQNQVNDESIRNDVLFIISNIKENK
jgi:hypothetical protein